jgi:hypothetical protein
MLAYPHKFITKLTELAAMDLVLLDLFGQIPWHCFTQFQNILGQGLDLLLQVEYFTFHSGMSSSQIVQNGLVLLQGVARSLQKLRI